MHRLLIALMAAGTILTAQPFSPEAKARIDFTAQYAQEHRELVHLVPYGDNLTDLIVYANHPWDNGGVEVWLAVHGNEFKKAGYKHVLFFHHYDPSKKGQHPKEVVSPDGIKLTLALYRQVAL